MRVGTWNVEYACGTEKNERRRRRLTAADCDIWVLTETHDDLSPGPEYASVATDPRRRKGPRGRWTTIWSRHPIRPLAVADPHRTCAALLETPRGPVVVFGTVLPWHTDVGDDGKPKKQWEEFYRVVPEQTREWARLREAHPDAALIVAGDLNMNLGGTHYYGTHKGRAMLRDGFAAARLKCVTETERVAGLRHGPIDHICVAEELAANARVVAAWEGDDEGLRLSDHSGLAVELL